MKSLLPQNSTKFEINFEQAFARVSDVSTPARTFNNPMLAPSVALPWLAWEQSVDYWNREWNDEQKRNTIASAYFVHCHKGTIGALELALSSLNIAVRVEEWHKMSPIGAPFTFKIHIESNQIGVTQAQIEELLKIVQNSKNLRSHMIDQTITVKSETEVYTAAVTQLGNEIEYATPAPPGNLFFDGTWSLNGLQNFKGIKV